jgi:hypothetical protein
MTHGSTLDIFVAVNSAYSQQARSVQGFKWHATIYEFQIGFKKNVTTVRRGWVIL